MTKVELIDDVQKFLDYLTSDEINVLDANFVGDEVIDVHYENNENFIVTNSKTNVVIAAFTTAYARLKLYDVLDQLQERVLYYDTDSIIFVSKPDDPEPPIGPYLGELTDELKGGGTSPRSYRVVQRTIATKRIPARWRPKYVGLP